ncbi:hypothetical protein [Phormidesmis sp. 146-33]
MRRWIVNALERPPYRGLTAYIGNELRLLDGVRQPLCFLPLTLKRRGEAAGWSIAIEALLADDTRLPNPSALLANPTYHVERVGEATQIGKSINFLGLPARSKSSATDNQSQPASRKKVKKTDPNTRSAPMLLYGRGSKCSAQRIAILAAKS